MVPHGKFLQVAVLAGLSRPNWSAVAEEIAQKYDVNFPHEVESFFHESVMAVLPSDVSGELCFADAALASTKDLCLRASDCLGLSQYLRPAVGNKEYLDVVLPHPIGVWRAEYKRLTEFLDICLLCNIDPVMVASDVHLVWGVRVSDAEVTEYSLLFADPEGARGIDLLDYQNTIPQDKATKLISLSQQHKDFVRWRMGVPISQDSDTVLNRLMSDAYYTERFLKAKAGDGGFGFNLSKDELARIKMERDTIFKAMDRKLKMEAHKAGGADNEAQSFREALERLSLVALKDPNEEFKAIEDIPDFERLDVDNGSRTENQDT